MTTSFAARRFVSWAPLAAVLIVLLPVVAAAQEPVKSFDQLNTRLKVGDTVWVTDAQGREVKGRITSIRPAALEVRAKGTQTLLADDVRVVARQRRDSLRNGVLWGGVVGCAGTYVTACAADREFCDDPETGYGLSAALLGFLGGMGVGAAVDGLIHGKDVVYRVPGASGSARLSLVPVVTPRAKGVAVTYSFWASRKAR